MTKSELRNRLAKDRHVLFIFLSPTGSVLKVGFWILVDDQRRADSFASVAFYVKERLVYLPGLSGSTYHGRKW